MYAAHRLYACLTAAAFAVALIPGCGGDNSDNNNPATPPDDQDAAAQAETALPSDDAAPDVEQADDAAPDAVEEPVAQQDAAEEYVYREDDVGERGRATAEMERVFRTCQARSRAGPLLYVERAKPAGLPAGAVALRRSARTSPAESEPLNG